MAFASGCGLGSCAGVGAGSTVEVVNSVAAIKGVVSRPAVDSVRPSTSPDGVRFCAAVKFIVVSTPIEDVFARSTPQHVILGIAAQRVGPFPTEDHIGSAATQDTVIPGTAPKAVVAVTAAHHVITTASMHGVITGVAPERVSTPRPPWRAARTATSPFASIDSLLLIADNPNGDRLGRERAGRRIEPLVLGPPALEIARRAQPASP